MIRIVQVVVYLATLYVISNAALHAMPKEHDWIIHVATFANMLIAMAPWISEYLKDGNRSPKSSKNSE